MKFYDQFMNCMAIMKKFPNNGNLVHVNADDEKTIVTDGDITIITYDTHANIYIRDVVYI